MSAIRDHSAPWQQNLRAIWFAELVAIAAFTIVIPILPLYVKELGIEGERQASIWAGAIVSAHGVTMAFFGPVWGAVGDRYGRKIMVERAMVAGSILTVLMGLVRTPQQLVLLRALQGCFTGTVAAATALVATSTPVERAGYALGTLQMAVFVGASAGPLVGGVVADTLGYRAAFFVTGALLFTAAIGVLLFVKEPARDDPAPNSATAGDEEGPMGRRALKQLGLVLSSGPLLAVMGVRLAMRLAARLTMPTLPLFVETIAPSNTRVATMTGLISGAHAVGGAIGGRQLGELGDRIGYRSILGMCALASVLCYVPQSLVGRSVWLIPLQTAAGVAMGGMLASLSALLASLAPRGREGLVYGVDASIVSTANAVGPMAGSALAAWIGLRTPFLAAAVVFGIGGLAALRIFAKPRQSS
jgi:DHA1 family multidrug resistance protein-like MFS transporter